MVFLRNCPKSDFLAKIFFNKGEKYIFGQKFAKAI